MTGFGKDIRLAAVCAALIVGASSATLPAHNAVDDDGLVPSSGSRTGSSALLIGALTPGQPIERPLARGEDHHYRLPMKTGDFASLIVEQRGINVIVELRGADGRVIADVDDESRSRGQEQIGVVADCDGTYTISISASPGVIASGLYTLRVASRRAALDADRATQELRSLRTRAARLYESERIEEARSLLEQALTLTERTRRPDDEQVALVSVDLAAVYVDVPDFARAESLYAHAVAILDRALGGDHPTTAFVRSRLARLYQRSGQRPKAEALLRPALEILEKTLGPEHLWFVRSLGTLSALRNDAGDFDEAENIVRRQMAILERIDYTDSTLYAGALNNLGEISARKHDDIRSEELLRRSVAVYEKVRGPEDYALSYPFTNLGILARGRKDFEAAEAYYRRALSIRQELLGLEHPDLVIILNNLANLLSATGQYARSLETHAYALRIGERALGPYHQNTLLSVGNIARVSAASGDFTRALDFQRRAETIVERQLALNLAVGSERQKLVFMRGMSEHTDRTISLHLRDTPDNADAAALATLVLLQRKGRVLDAMIDTVAALRQRIGNASEQAVFDRLATTTAELAHLTLNAPDTSDVDARASAIKELEARKERLEAELSEQSAEFRSETQPITVDAIQALMPPDAALVEFTIFRPFNPKADRNADAYAPPHYAAYVVRPHTGPRGVDLGAAAPIDAAIDAWREALRDPRRTGLAPLARAVDERVIQPLRALFGEATQLLISPDGELNLVPFEALVDEQGQYLIQRYAVSYLTSGRDLLRMGAIRATPGKPVIFADPLFGEPAATDGDRPIRTAGSRTVARRSVTTREDLATVYFAPLAATADEAQGIKTLFPDATLFTGPSATKRELQRVDAPLILHIASHGFFLHDAEIDTPHPLLRSGLALAGANLHRDSHDDGILTALEASGLNLWGTKLVTLSACDTGIGEVRNGEGVYGLRRAFLLAGAETVVMSLWPVSDATARETMVAYYKGLRAGLGRRDALRRAKLAMLTRNGRRHPFYWAGFIQSGEWANLDGVR